MQAGAVLLTTCVANEYQGLPVVTRMNHVKFKAMVRPGDTVDLHVELTDQKSGAFFLAAKVMVDGKLALTFDFACKAVPNSP
jgi:3-hydroxyacyl-[acyl-carrier-protein] dehydratase